MQISFQMGKGHSANKLYSFLRRGSLGYIGFNTRIGLTDITDLEE